MTHNSQGELGDRGITITILTQNTPNIYQLAKYTTFRRICGSIRNVWNRWNNMSLQDSSNISRKFVVPVSTNLIKNNTYVRKYQQNVNKGGQFWYLRCCALQARNTYVPKKVTWNNRNTATGIR